VQAGGVVDNVKEDHILHKTVNMGEI
jgi:hypothetical protein